MAMAMENLYKKSFKHLKIANDCKRMFKRGLKRSDYPDNLEYSKYSTIKPKRSC